ncbi:zinc ribbon-containing protein [Shewanella youngdeokensis]|uniref:Zinc ribbon-containing protein n=1 Tax=Shewanella youngdeokensis TaxID=2999068 RepID=A0ABZ0K036_9GAMM|nr:zinc ribbon-containing protein [Shewanella sp. DAU334]
MSEQSTALLSLYEALFQQIKEQYSKDNSLTVKSLYRQTQSSKQFLAIKQQAKEEELALVEQFLKRDIASFLQEKNAKDLNHSPTMITIENTLWHWLSEITDRSQLEWHEVVQDFKHQGQYQTGEIVGQGTMVCAACGHETKIEFPSVLPDCIECDHSLFTREALAP